jgi:hypothetical protein
MAKMIRATRTHGAARAISSRYVNAAWRSAREHRGWDGPATRRALRPRLEYLHGLGLTARACGAVLAREWRLHSAAKDWREIAQGRAAEARG